MVERFSLNLSYRGLPRRASERAVVYPLSVGGEAVKNERAWARTKGTI